MGGVFGGGDKGAAKEAAAQNRRSEQRSNEEASRNRQKGERGSLDRRGRDMLVGSSADQGSQVLGQEASVGGMSNLDKIRRKIAFMFIPKSGKMGQNYTDKYGG